LLLSFLGSVHPHGLSPLGSATPVPQNAGVRRTIGQQGNAVKTTLFYIVFSTFPAPIFSAFHPFFELLSATARQESFQTERESVATTSRVGRIRDPSQTSRDPKVAFKLTGL